MSELAFNANGDAFEIPAGAVAWRVRKMKPKGAPEVAYGRNGMPLVLPIEAEIEDLRAEVNAPGKYRLDPIDAGNKPIEGATAGYVYVHELLAPTSDAPEAPASAAGLMPLPAASDNVVIEAMRMNTEIARTVVAQFPQMLEASAVLLRAADGAGLPARPGMAVVEEDDEDEEVEEVEDKSGGGLDIGALLMQAAPLLIALTGGKLKIPDLLNWNKAAAKGQAARSEAAPNTSAREPSPEAKAAAEEESIEQKLKSDPAAMQHFIAIMQALTPEERVLGQALASELSPADRATWFAELKQLDVADAVAKVRGLLRHGSKGDAS